MASKMANNARPPAAENGDGFLKPGSAGKLEGAQALMARRMSALSATGSSDADDDDDDDIMDGRLQDSDDSDDEIELDRQLRAAVADTVGRGRIVDRQLRAALGDCSRQRMRSMKMLLRKQSNFDSRVSVKDLTAVLQDNNITLDNRCMQKLLKKYEDKRGVDYIKLWQTLEHTHKKTGRDSVLANRRSSEDSSGGTSPSQEFDAEILKRLHRRLSSASAAAAAAAGAGQGAAASGGYDLQQLRTACNQEDKQSTGVVDRTRLMQICNSVKLPVRGALLKAVINRCTQSDDEHINYEEMISMLVKAQNYQDRRSPLSFRINSPKAEWQGLSDFNNTLPPLMGSDDKKYSQAAATAAARAKQPVPVVPAKKPKAGTVSPSNIQNNKKANMVARRPQNTMRTAPPPAQISITVSSTDDTEEAAAGAQETQPGSENIVAAEQRAENLPRIGSLKELKEMQSIAEEPKQEENVPRNSAIPDIVTDDKNPTGPVGEAAGDNGKANGVLPKKMPETNGKLVEKVAQTKLPPRQLRDNDSPNSNKDKPPKQHAAANNSRETPQRTGTEKQDTSQNNKSNASSRSEQQTNGETKSNIAEEKAKTLNALNSRNAVNNGETAAAGQKGPLPKAETDSRKAPKIKPSFVAAKTVSRMNRDLVVARNKADKNNATSAGSSSTDKPTDSGNAEKAKTNNGSGASLESVGQASDLDPSDYVEFSRGSKTQKLPVFDEYKQMFTSSPDPLDMKAELDWIDGYNGVDLAVVDSGNVLVYAAGSFVVLHDVTNQRQRHYKQHTELVTSVAVTDNGTVASAQKSSETGQNKQPACVHVWNSFTLQCLKVLKSDVDNISCLTFDKSQDLLYGLAGDQKNELIVWNTKAELIARTNIEANSLLCGGCSPRQVLVLGSGRVDFWSVDTESRSLGTADGVDIPVSYDGSKVSVTCCSWSSDGELVIGDTYGSVYICNQDGQFINNITDAHTGSVSSLLFVNDQLLTAGVDGAVCAWEWSRDCTMEQSGKLQLPIEEGGISGLTLHGEDLTVIVGTVNGSLIKVQVDPHNLASVLIIDQNYITQSRYSDVVFAKLNGNILTTVGRSGLVAMYDVTKRVTVWKQVLPVTGIVSSDICMDCIMLAAATSNSVKLFQMEHSGQMHQSEDSQFVEIYSPNFAGKTLTTVNLSEDSETVAVGDSDGHVYILGMVEPENGDLRWDIVADWQAHNCEISGIDWSSNTLLDDIFIVRTLSAQAEIAYWNSDSGEQFPVSRDLLPLSWATHNCKLSSELSGIWLSSEELHNITTTPLHVNKELALAAVIDDKNGVSVYRVPCWPNKTQSCKLNNVGSSYSTHIKQILFTGDGRHVITVCCTALRTTVISLWSVDSEHNA